MKLKAECLQCNHTHPIDFDPVHPGSEISDWYTKHFGHEGVQIRHPERRQRRKLLECLTLAGGLLTETGLGSLQEWIQEHIEIRIAEMRNYRIADAVGQQSPVSLYAMLSNADVKIAYGTTTTPTLTLASLAASSTRLGGRESSSISNASNKYLDVLLAGNYRQAATNTQAGRIRTAVVGSRDNTPNWPDVFDGTDSTETVTTQAMYDSVCKIASEIVTAATANAINPFGPVAIAGLFGGALPVARVIFVSHDAQTSTNAWSATEGDHAVRETPIYATVI